MLARGERADRRGRVQPSEAVHGRVVLREPRHERAVLNASFLVVDGRLADFDAEVERLSQEDAGRITFKLIGPMLAHSFAEGGWKTKVAGGSGPWA